MSTIDYKLRREGNLYFLQSECVKIFPSAYRGTSVTEQGIDKIKNTGINIESKLSTEFNFTHLSSVFANKTYLIDAVYSGDNFIITCCINGYYIEFTINQEELTETKYNIKYIKLCVEDAPILSNDTVQEAQKTTIIKNLILAERAKVSEEFDGAQNNHYLDTTIGEGTTGVLCFGGIAFCSEQDMTPNAYYLPLLHIKVPAVVSSGGERPDYKDITEYLSDASKFYTVRDLLKLSIPNTQVEVKHTSMRQNLAHDWTDSDTYATYNEVLPIAKFAQEQGGAILGGGTNKTLETALLGGDNNYNEATNSLVFGYGNRALKQKESSSLSRQATINLGFMNITKSRNQDATTFCGTVGSNNTALDSQLVLGFGINPDSWYNKADDQDNQPKVIIGDGNCIEIKGHDTYITGYNGSNWVGNLIVCGLNKENNEDNNDKSSIIVDENGKLIRYIPTYSYEHELEHATRFIYSLTQDSKGNIVYKTRDFSLSSDTQGIVKLNSEPTSIVGLTTNDTPTFTGIIINGTSKTTKLNITSTAADALTCSGVAKLNKGAVITGETTIQLTNNTNDLQLHTVDSNNQLDINCKVNITKPINCTSTISATGNISSNANISATGQLSATSLEITGSIKGTRLSIGNTTGHDPAFKVTEEGYVTAQSYTAWSDKRLKENIIEYKPQKSILGLPVYKYDFINGPKNQIGCLAQDLKEICPELVTENENGYLSIQEFKLVYLLLDEVRKLKEEIKELKK